MVFQRGGTGTYILLSHQQCMNDPVSLHLDFCCFCCSFFLFNAPQFVFSLFFFFLKILFIYLTETASQRGNTSRGVGEEEAGS